MSNNSWRVGKCYFVMDQRWRNDLFHCFLWFFIILVCRTLITQAQPRTTDRARSSFSFSIYYCHSCSIFLPSPPTPSHLRSDAHSRTTLKAPKSAGLWIYRLCGHDYGRSERSNTHNRISFHQNGSKGCLLPLARLH